eukprot:CAMPEP_0197646246 /NCGR_PEP_ID=MMETSP1338-20131121/22514_1 /TAXON_ID=43686 ORGANISM="Pelagodinium beii, Strain RCC1491" /NCGR_SAMPLE_ID=MMETSP1338 /ASSEMBLY_ACC=CAM_ASM_000754 /LENGTH=114 /DNA_ID=CAMNT_0043219863 /DNA_START=70 /DNA_END=411 /DNA_ORIENTATION=+
MPSRSALPKVLLATGAVVALRQFSAFVPPQLGESRRAALLGAVVAANLASPADAYQPTVSFFGLSPSGVTVSDAYSQNNADNPYDQFSDGKDAIYQKDSAIMKKRKAQLEESFR